jgi:hypothetical protein
VGCCGSDGGIELLILAYARGLMAFEAAISHRPRQLPGREAHLEIPIRVVVVQAVMIMLVISNGRTDRAPSGGTRGAGA